MSDRRRRNWLSFPRALAAFAACSLAAMLLGSAAGAAPGGKPYTVCAKGCKYTAIQAAVDDAADGGTIAVGPGVFAGGVTIEKNITLAGAGAKRTVIAGTPSASVVEAVSGDIVLRDVAITGGSVGVAVSFFPRVTVADSIVADNEWGTGGFGGSVAVQRSVVTRNSIAGVGPIFSGGVTVDDSTVSKNGMGVLGDSRMLVVVRNSRILANRNSGIVMPVGDLEVYGSTIRGNTGVNGGGIALHVGRAGSTARVVESTIRQTISRAK